MCLHARWQVYDQACKEAHPSDNAVHAPRAQAVFCYSSEPAQGLTYLIVDCHDGDKRSVGPDGSLQLRQVYEAVLPDWQVGDVMPSHLQGAAAVQHALVCSTGCHISPCGCASGHAHQWDGLVCAGSIQQPESICKVTSWKRGEAHGLSVW